MYIKKVIIRDFKNFTNETTFEFTAKNNILAGKNGCGKTSVLDAITWALIGRLFNSSQQGWKPKELYTDPDGNVISKVKQLFNTSVEVIIGFDDGQKDISIKRTSSCGKSTDLYYNQICDTQKQIDKYLEDALGFDLKKLLIYINPEVLFNQNITDQAECGKIIFDAVRHKVQDQLRNLYEHLFDKYNLGVGFLEEDSMEKAIAKKLVNDIKKKMDAGTSENDIIEDLEIKIEENSQTLIQKNEVIKSQELILNDYFLKLRQEAAYKKLEQELDKAEQQLRQKLFEKSVLVEDLNKFEKSKNELVLWLNSFEDLLKKNPSIHDIKVAFGLEKSDSSVSSAKINVLNLTPQRQKCPICGNWYIPKPEQKKDSIGIKIAEANDQLAKKNQPDTQVGNQTFDYVPRLTEIKKQISDLKEQIDVQKDKILAIEKQINLMEYKTIEELQAERNNVSKFFASLDSGKKISKQVNNMKADCEECNINNRYLNILLETIKLYVKDKLVIIKNKLNDNLTSGEIQLFKIQANGVYKDCVSIIDKSSSASYSETNQSNRIKLGVEVCQLLQDFNNINIPIFIDEIGRFNDYSFINQINHQIIATLPTNDENLKIIHS